MTRPHPLPLPTPPNSISPALPPHGLRAQLQRAKLEPIDSDLDLHDGPHGRAAGSPPFDSAGAINPALLARHHLPEILLNHGPLAIRHIMGYLTTSVPGFAGIPPAKARRLVVGALEGRGSGGDGAAAGRDGDVAFEKVGWGRWDARRHGQPPRDPSARQRLSPTSAGGAPLAAGIPIARGGWATVDRPRGGSGGGGGGGGGLRAAASSVGGDSATFSHDGRDMTMLDHEADKMSMDDGSGGSASCSPAPDGDDVAMNDDPEDATDDEDWAAVGAAALRAASYSGPAAPTTRGLPASRVYSPGGGGSGLRSVSYNAGTAAAATCGFTLSAMGGTSDAQEREAVEALLCLGSV